MDANRRRHIFGEPRHNLGPLVRRYGGEEAVAGAIEDVVKVAFDNGDLAVDDQGMYQQIFEISGFSVTVRGRVIDGTAHVGTAWIR